LKILATHSNYWHSVVEEMLFHQKEKFEKGHGSHSHHHENMFSIGVLWNGVIVVMIAYFLLSIIHSIAAAQLRKDLQSLKK
jgi:hypothetical protein